MNDTVHWVMRPLVDSLKLRLLQTQAQCLVKCTVVFLLPTAHRAGLQQEALPHQLSWHPPPEPRR